MSRLSSIIFNIGFMSASIDTNAVHDSSFKGSMFTNKVNFKGVFPNDSIEIKSFALRSTIFI